MSLIQRISVGLLCLALFVPAARAQFVFERTTPLDFDDPEAWAMKYFSTLSLTTGLGPVVASEVGSVELGFEVMQAPELSEEEQRVGFGGRKVEDLNRTPLWARFRARVGLPGKLGLGLGIVPPAEIDGVQPFLVSAYLERPLLERDRWGLGARAYMQQGSVEGDFTCKASQVGVPGTPGGEFGCEAPSEDEVTLDHWGLELSWWRALTRREDGPKLHAALGWTSHDLEFQVDARTNGIIDRSLLLADGETPSYMVGVSFPLGARMVLGTELFYSPLDVRRLDPSSGEFGPTQNDELFHLRALLRYRLR